MYNTIMLLSTITAVIILIGALAGGVYGAAAAFMFSLAIILFLYIKSESLVLGIYRAEPSDDYKLTEMLKRLAREAKIPVPRLYIVKTTHFMPNSLSVGRGPDNAAVVITGSLLSLKDEEIEAVLAHEVAHIRNKDTLVNMVAATLGTAIAYLSQVGYWNLFLEGGETRSGSHLTGMMLMVMFAPLAALLIRLSVSHSEEYRADYFAALMTKKPRYLARALEDIHEAISKKPLRGHAATAHLWIANPLHDDWFNNMFSTHPPVRERVKKLLELEGRGIE